MKAALGFLVLAAGCGRVDGGDTTDHGDSGHDTLLDASEPDATTDSVSVEAGPCPASPPLVGPADCPLDVECFYYDNCYKGIGSGERYICISPFERPKQWAKTVADCAAVSGPDGCPLAPPLPFTVCAKTAVSCKYKGCSRYVCTPTDGGLSVWTPNTDDCFADAAGG